MNDVQFLSSHNTVCISNFTMSLNRFQSLDILPLSQYGPLLQYLKENATPLCQLLEPVLPVKAKEDIATILINIMQAENCAIAFLVDLVYTDIKTNGGLLSFVVCERQNAWLYVYYCLTVHNVLFVIFW